jgi:large subunit ribosomal protein L23
MRDVHDIILAPVVTEKSADQIEALNVYTFVVAEGANKIEIRQAVERIWDVRVKKVRTMRYAGKARRSLLGQMARNWNKGRRPDFKKAVVELEEGDHIEFYEVG